MKKIKALMPEAYDFNGKLPLKQAIPLGLQHVMAMFVGNLTPLLIIPPPIILVTLLNTPINPELVPKIIGTLPPTGPIENN